MTNLSRAMRVFASFRSLFPKPNVLNVLWPAIASFLFFLPTFSFAVETDSYIIYMPYEAFGGTGSATMGAGTLTFEVVIPDPVGGVQPMPQFTITGANFATTAGNGLAAAQYTQTGSSVITYGSSSNVTAEFQLFSAAANQYLQFTFSPYNPNGGYTSAVQVAEQTTPGSGGATTSVGATAYNVLTLWTKTIGKRTDCHCDTDPTGARSVGEPIELASGNVTYDHTDYTTAGKNPLSFTRSYNSLSYPYTLATTLGTNWRSNYDRYIQLPSSSLVLVERPTGEDIVMRLVGSVWTPDLDTDVTLTQSGSTWIFTDQNDTTETYTTNAAGTAAILTSVTLRDGYTQVLAYNGSGQLATVTDSYGRTITLAYTNGKLTAATFPENNVYHYQYNANGSLLSVASPIDYQGRYPTYTYYYENTSVPYAMTGITDNINRRYQDWTYDSNGRGLTSYGGGTNYVDYAGVAYNDTSGTRAVTNAYNQVDTYSFTTFNGTHKVSGISRASTSNTPAMSRGFTYDSNGYLASETDWNGNSTTYVRNTHGLPTTINEAVGSAVARSTTIAYDTTWVHLPATITTPGVTTTFTYDTSGNELTRTLADTSGSGQPSRTWTHSYSTVGNVLTEQNPRGNTMTYTYTAGALTQITNALNQTTNITSYTAGGYPLTIVDANNVTHTNSYDAQMRLHTKAVTTGGGTYTYTYLYTFDNVVASIARPDGTTWSISIDGAHRQKGIDDGTEYFQSLLEPFGHIYQTVAEKDGTNTVSYKHNATFDYLGRKLTDVDSSNNQTTTYTYDNNGNVLTLTDPLSNVTTYTYDALNRVATSTPQASNATTYTYNAWDKATSVVDGRGDSWTYGYDGFGELLSSQGPRSGQVATLYAYDQNGNVTQKTDARAIVANYSYDALDRLLTIVYPASGSENVTNVYDQTGHGFGIGHLTSATDAAGTLSRTYDERGNVTTDSRNVVGVVLTTSYAYDSVGRRASITYPSGITQTLAYNAADQVSGFGYQSGGGTSLPATVAHAPWGPITSVTNFQSSSPTDSFTFNTDYWMTSATAQVGGTSVMNRAYSYDAAGNVTKANDSINSANENEYLYDGNNRMDEFHFGTTAGGNRYALDNIGNVTSDITLTSGLASGATTQYTNGPGSTLSQIYNTGTSVTETVSSDADNRISGISPAIPGTTGTTFLYNNAGRLTQVKDVSGNVIASYLYDEFGHRLVKTVGPNNFFYIYDGNQLLEETYGTGAVVQDYLYVEGRLVSLWIPGPPYLVDVHADRIGAPQSVTDYQGNLLWKADWNPHGDLRNLTSSGITLNVRYPGQYFDNETGFIQNGAREYVPQWGRYMEEDPLGQAADENVRAYVSNRPTAFVDPSGFENEEVGQCVGGTTSVTSYKDAKPPGRCSQDRYNQLRNEKKAACPGYGLPACYPEDSYEQNLIKMNDLQRCLAARENLDNECFDGGNKGHEDQRKQLTNSILDCIDKMNITYPGFLR